MSDLKIAMLVRQFSPHGGLELYAHKLVEGLLASGVSVTVVCQDNSSELQAKGLAFKFISKAGKSGSKYSRLNSLFQNANEALGSLVDIDLIHSQHCPTNNADLVTFHNHSSQRLSQVGLWWEKTLNDTKRRVVPAYRLRDEHDDILLRRALCLIFPAEVMKDDFFAAYPFLQGPPPKPYVVAHPGASMSSRSAHNGNSDSRVHDAAPHLPGADSHASAFAARQDDVFNFLFVGRGFRKKGLDILFSACCILKKKTTRKFCLSIAGLSAKPADRLRMNLLGLNDCVKYLGFQKDMEAVYSQAKSIILPSRVEPFGMAPVQGMQRGLVPIVSRVSGVAEVLHDGEDSLLLNDHLNADELADLMLKVMSDEALLKRLSSNAILTAEKVSWQETVTQTMKAYEIAISLKNSTNWSRSN